VKSGFFMACLKTAIDKPCDKDYNSYRVWYESSSTTLLLSHYTPPHNTAVVVANLRGPDPSTAI
jgi:hypothetical protein